MLEFPPRSILDQLREGRRAAGAAADDTDTDDEALGEALGEMTEEQSGAAGVLANPDALDKHAKRTYRDDTKRWVDVPDEIPERLKSGSSPATVWWQFGQIPADAPVSSSGTRVQTSSRAAVGRAP